MIIVGAWISPGQEEIAILFDDDTMAIETHGGSRSISSIPAGWVMIFGGAA